MENDEEEPVESTSRGGLPIDAIASYIAFGKRALKPRRWLIATVFVLGLVVTGLLFKYLPRTYEARTVLMAQGNAVLDSRDSNPALAGAVNLVMRHENLENIIRDLNLIKKNEERRPPLLKLKDNLIKKVVGEFDEKTKMSILIYSMETRLFVDVEKGDLDITAHWTDPQTAAELAEAARESFLRARHNQEMSAFEEKMSVLDQDGAKLRAQVTELADQIRAAKQKSLERRKSLKAGVQAGVAGAATSAPLPRSTRSVKDAGLPELQERLANARRRLAELEGDRERRIREERAKLDELRLKFTPSHPQVITQEERYALASQEGSELLLARTEAKNVEAELAQRKNIASVPGMGGGRAGSLSAPLGAEFAELLGDVDPEDEVDPALTGQYSSVYMRYGRLLDDISAANHDLNIAEVAFKHRYQIVVPAEAPNSPIKPKRAVIVLAGLALSLLLAFSLPILLELRRDVVIERWQVQQLQLPVLAEVRLPPARTTHE